MPESGREMEALMRRGATKGLAEAALLLLHEAQQNIPKGDPDVDPDPNVSLRESGHIEVEHGGRSVLVVFDVHYAAKQHEQQRYKHPRGGHAKYLEKPALALIPKLEGILASEVRSLFVSRTRG